MSVSMSDVYFYTGGVRHFPQQQRHLTLTQRHRSLIRSGLHFLQCSFLMGKSKDKFEDINLDMLMTQMSKILVLFLMVLSE